MTLDELNEHWRRWNREAVERDTRPPVEIVVNKKRGIKMLVDAMFGPWAYLKGLNLHSKGYARHGQWANGKWKRTRISRMIAEACGLAIEGLEVDHIQPGNTLDNRLSNLRPATRTQNALNRGKRKGTKSRFKGVCPSRNGKRHVAAIRVNGELKTIGTYDTEEEAAKAFDAAAIIHHDPDFRQLNFTDVME